MLSFGKIEVKENVVLAPYTSYKIGGPAEYFYESKHKEDLVSIVRKAQKIRVPFLVLGQGTNVLISDKGIKGLVVINRCQKFKVDGNLVNAESGVLLPKLIRELAQKNLGGLEFLANIPGTIGGAIVGNAGSYGKSIGDVLMSAELLLPNGEIRRYKKDFFNFSYRESRLKKENLGVILSTVIQTVSKPKRKILKEINEDRKLRQSKHPFGFSCGSFFKNADSVDLPAESRDKFEKFIMEGKIPAAKLIEECGLKGTKIGRARISEKHANFIVNLEEATFLDVLRLANKVRTKVFNKFGIKLEEEVRILG